MQRLSGAMNSSAAAVIKATPVACCNSHAIDCTVEAYMAAAAAEDEAADVWAAPEVAGAAAGGDGPGVAAVVAGGG